VKHHFFEVALLQGLFSCHAPPSVFLSHSSLDNASAERRKDWLKKQGFAAPFLDFDKHNGIQPGANWEKTLYREIDRSQALLILLSTNWNDSKWCFAEFIQARALGKVFVQVVESDNPWPCPTDDGYPGKIPARAEPAAS
jgi:hypothetical protein